MALPAGRIAVLGVIAVVAIAAAPASGAPQPPVSSGDPLASCTAGADSLGGTNFPASEVEPFVAADPTTPGRLVAVWQQDRWWRGAKTVIKQSTAHWLEDKDSITADPKRPGMAYVVWNRDGPTPSAPAKTFLSITRNGGDTWSKPRAIVNPGKHGSTIGNVIAVDHRHRALLDVFLLQAAKTVVKRHCTWGKLPHSKKKRRVCTTRRVIAPHAPL